MPSQNARGQIAHDSETSENETAQEIETQNDYI